MTLAQVIALINSNIVPNGNNEITANVLRPILIEMLQQPNDLIGELDELNTVETDTLVKAINSINNALSDVDGFTLLSGQGDPNEQSFPSLSIADLYSENDGLGSPLALWIYDGTKFIRLSDRYISAEIPQNLTSIEQLTARSNINATDRRLEELASDLTENEKAVIQGKLGIEDADLTGLLENPTYDSDTHIFTMDIVGGGTFSIDFPIEALITNVELDNDNNLVITFEDGSVTTIPLNTLLVGVVKSVNGKNPNSQGVVTININDIPNLQDELENKADKADVVPYTGATTNVNLGTRSITSTGGFIGNATTATTWQTARNFTIGNTTKSVNGSANVSWSLAEIGLGDYYTKTESDANFHKLAKNETEATSGGYYPSLTGLDANNILGNISVATNTGTINAPNNSHLISFGNTAIHGFQIIKPANINPPIIRTRNTSGWLADETVAYQSWVTQQIDNAGGNYITTNTNQTGLSGDKTTSGVWTFGEVRKAGQNDTQILLAGGGHRPVSDFALSSQVYTKTEALDLFVGQNGSQTIYDTKTFDSAPIVPNGTLNGHTVNLGQLNDAIAGIDVSNKANTDGSNTTGGTWTIDDLKNDDVGIYASTQNFNNATIYIPPTDALGSVDGIVLMRSGAPLVIAENTNPDWDGYIYRAGLPNSDYPDEAKTGNYLIESKHRFRSHKHENLDALDNGVGEVILTPYNAIEHQYFDVNVFDGSMSTLELDIQSPERDELTGYEIRRNHYGQRISVNVITNAKVVFTNVQGVSFPNGGNPGVYKFVWDGVWLFDGYSPNEF